MSPRIAYNDKEVDLLARLIRSEALGEGQEGMLLVGNVAVNRVAFAGVNTPLFNGPINALERELALRTINGYRNAPATYALWFKNPGRNVVCPEVFYGYLAGRFGNHCFYDPGEDLNCQF